MTGISVILFFFYSDCGFDHVIYTLSDAKYHSEADGVYCRAIAASALKLWISIKVCVSPLVYKVGFVPMI